jgi:hypothetical protein
MFVDDFFFVSGNSGSDFCVVDGRDVPTTFNLFTKCISVVYCSGPKLLKISNCLKLNISFTLKSNGWPADRGVAGGGVHRC